MQGNDIFDNITAIKELVKTPFGIFLLCIYLIVLFSCFAILVSILINFVEAKTSRNVVKKKKSIIATGTMMIFFGGYYLIIKNEIGSLTVVLSLRIVLMLIGTLLIIGGTLVNIKGRLDLGKNWANQIKIYAEHTLVRSGVYKIVRHPLYASLIWMFYGGALIYGNYVSFLANTFIFIPIMYYRAKQEEKLLIQRFPTYAEFQKAVGMFIPRLFTKISKDAL
jgi:protein-S-isoprenylcysteine O-methyltransferase Ste14